MRGGDGGGHSGGWMANYSHVRPPDGETAAGPRICRGDERRADHSRGKHLWNSTVYNPRYLHLDHGSWRSETVQRAALGCGGKNRLGLDIHSPCDWSDRIRAGPGGCSMVIRVACAIGVGAVIILLSNIDAVRCQDAENRRVTVEAEELPTAYGAPPDLSHGRISTLTKSYVLLPFGFEFEAGYEGAVFRHGLPTQLFRQEIEMGLPARFTVGIQNQVEHFAGETRDRSFTLEARYALADWNKLPLNPAISAEYQFGLSNALPDSGELALLISHDFPHLIECAMNIFVDREFGGRRSTT